MFPFCSVERKMNSFLHCSDWILHTTLTQLIIIITIGAECCLLYYCIETVKIVGIEMICPCVVSKQPSFYLLLASFVVASTNSEYSLVESWIMLVEMSFSLSLLILIPLYPIKIEPFTWLYSTDYWRLFAHMHVI